METEKTLDELLDTSLPISKIKKIAKLNPEMHMVNSDAVQLLAKATDIFIRMLAKNTYSQAMIDGRKTVQEKDLKRVIKRKPECQFLIGALETWPDPAHDVEQQPSQNEEQQPNEEDGQQEAPVEESSMEELMEEVIEEADTMDNEPVVEEDKEEEEKDDENTDPRNNDEFVEKDI